MLYYQCMKYIPTITTTTLSLLVVLLLVGLISYVLTPAANAEEEDNSCDVNLRPDEYKGDRFTAAESAIKNWHLQGAAVADELSLLKFHFRDGFQSLIISSGVQEPALASSEAFEELRDVGRDMSALHIDILWGQYSTYADAKSESDRLTALYNAKLSVIKQSVAERILGYVVALKKELVKHDCERLTAHRKGMLSYFIKVQILDWYRNEKKRMDRSAEMHDFAMLLYFGEQPEPETPTPPVVNEDEEDDDGGEEDSEEETPTPAPEVPGESVPQPNTPTCTGSVGSRECRGGGRHATRTPTADTHIVDVPAN